MGWGKRIAVYIAVFAAALTLLYLLLVLSAMIPNAAIEKNMRITARDYLRQQQFVLTDDGRLMNVTDNNADLKWAGICWHMGSGNPFVSALDTGYYDADGYGTAAGLYQSVVRDCPADTGYTRYWHGTAGILRLFHLWTDVQGVKTAGMIVLLALVILNVWLLFRKGYGDLGMCLALAFLLIHPWNLRLSMEYQPCFLVCFLLCPAFVLLEKRGNLYVGMLSVLSGTMTAFFDFLTTETVTLLLPLILVLGMRMMDKRLEGRKQTAILLLECLLCWGLAYAGTFLAKWIAVSIATGENHILPALASAGMRVSGSMVENTAKTLSPLTMGPAANLSALFGGRTQIEPRRIFAGLALSATVLVLLYRRYSTWRPIVKGTGFVLALGSVVLLRYVLLANHSYLHSFFTYRALISTLLAILTAMMLNLRPKRSRGGRR